MLREPLPKLRFGGLREHRLLRKHEAHLVGNAGAHARIVLTEATLLALAIQDLLVDPARHQRRLAFFARWVTVGPRVGIEELVLELRADDDGLVLGARVQQVLGAEEHHSEQQEVH